MSAAVADWRTELAEFERSQARQMELVVRRCRRLSPLLECRSAWLVIEHADHDQVLYLAGYVQRLNALADFARLRSARLAAGLTVEPVNGCLLVIHPGKLVTCLRLEPRDTWFEWCELYGFPRAVEPEDL